MSIESEIDDIHDRLHALEEKFSNMLDAIDKIRTENASSEYVLDEIGDMLRMG